MVFPDYTHFFAEVEMFWNPVLNYLSGFRSFFRTSVGRIVKLLFVLRLERVRRTTAGIHNVIFTLLLGSSTRNYDVTARHSK